MKKGWFGPHRIGYGVGPITWQGWLATALMVAGVAVSLIWLRPILMAVTGMPFPVVSFLLLIAWFVIYTAVIWVTYDRND
ncbi:MAG: hypothetical protein SGJ21_11215 [Alphaproteobacteria bacterium]|nr:hypothetical protein [Alphaproteobacteria bacterium]